MDHGAMSDYMAHGFCFSWEPGLVWLHVASDIVTGLAYYVIATAMCYFAYKRRDVPFFWVFLLFALFIIACGTTHFFAAYTVYRPDYWPEGYVKAFTAIISVIAAVVFIPKIPQAISLPSLARTLEERKQKEREVEEKNMELERFIYTISHDLKSPLVTISTFLGYLETDINTAEQARIDQDIGFIRTATDKMGQMLAELLELSRVGRIISNPEHVGFQDVVHEVLQLVAGHISERSVHVTVAESPLMLCGDRSRLVEIWQNLVENSVKYMGGEAEPRIDIGFDQVSGETVFFVCDNGMGIDPRYKEKIFGLFNKLDAGSEGSGLGLALVKRIVEVYGGRIWVESEGTGQGSCFRFTLPATLRS
jgi:signal transduction histidine kinase